VFAEQLTGGGPDRQLAVSMLNYGQQSADLLNPPIPKVDLGTTDLVGVGAIGNGFVWAMQRVPELKGTLSLIDHEVVDLSNLQRYVLTSQEHRGQKKAELAAAVFAARGGPPSDAASGHVG